MAIEKPIVWIDMEMTGLDPQANTILEIATIITNGNLEIIAEGPNLVIQTPLAVLQGMDDWNRTHHKKSGLWDAALNSATSLAEAEEESLAFLKQHVLPGTAPLAGNSVWQDRRFISRYMTKIDNFLHYRLIDVSTIKELCRRWYQEFPEYKEKSNNHRALDDIRESVSELAYYRQNAFRPPSEVGKK
jgi:oligoribonuclease